MTCALICFELLGLQWFSLNRFESAVEISECDRVARVIWFISGYERKGARDKVNGRMFKNTCSSMRWLRAEKSEGEVARTFGCTCRLVIGPQQITSDTRSTTDELRLPLERHKSPGCEKQSQYD